MNQFSHDRPEEWEAIARLPLNRQNEALRDAMGDPDRCRQYAREYAEERVHCHRDLSQPHRGAKAGGVGPQPSSPASALSSSDDVVCESDAQKQPAGDGRTFLPHRTPVGSDPYERCDVCDAPRGKHHLAFCDLRGEA